MEPQVAWILDFVPVATSAHSREILIVVFSGKTWPKFWSNNHEAGWNQPKFHYWGVCFWYATCDLNIWDIFVSAQRPPSWLHLLNKKRRHNSSSLLPRAGWMHPKNNFLFHSNNQIPRSSFTGKERCGFSSMVEHMPLFHVISFIQWTTGGMWKVSVRRPYGAKEGSCKAMKGILTHQTWFMPVEDGAVELFSSSAWNFCLGLAPYFKAQSVAKMDHRNIDLLKAGAKI